MQLGRLLIAALVLAGLGGTIWWIKKNDAPPEGSASAVEAGAPKPAKKSDAITIIAVNEGDLKQIQVEHRGEAPLIAEHETAGWRLTAPSPLEADQGAVIGVISVASNLTASRVVDDKGAADAANLASYGLNPPVVALKYIMKDGSAKRLLIGEETPDGSGVYAAADGDNRLFTILATQKAYFDKHLIDLREKHLLKFKPNDPTRLELSVSGKPTIEFAKSGEQWQIVKPKAMRADASQIDELINRLHTAQMEGANRAPAGFEEAKAIARKPAADPSALVAEEKKNAAAFAGAKPVAIARLTVPSGVLTLEVRKGGADFLARAAGPATNPGVYKIPNDIGEGVTKTLDDFRNKKLFDFGFDDPTRIEYSSKGQKRVFEQATKKWMSDSREMDSIAVQNLLDKLRDLAAGRLTDVAFGTAELEITVVSKAGTRTERVQIAPAGQGFLARRDNDTTLYSLDVAAVTALREAADGVRESQDSKASGGSDKAKK